jgi:hypothetical protein
MNCDDPKSGCPFRCSCDAPATLRCPECGEFYCAECFGPDNAEAWSPCRDCALKLAPPGLSMPTPTVIIHDERRATPAEERTPVIAKYNLPR